MKIDNLKKLKDKSNIRVIDLDELELTDAQHKAEDTVPNYVFVKTIVNPFINPEKIREFGDNIVDLLKGTRKYTSLGYDVVTPIKVFAINYMFASYITVMDAAIQMTKLVAYNDSTIMRYLIKAKFGLDDTAVNNILNNRAEFENVVASAVKKIKSGLVKLGHVEEILEKYLYDFRYDDSAQYTTKIAYKPCFRLLTADDATDMIGKVAGALFGASLARGFDAGYNHAIASTSDAFNTIAKLTPAEWFDRVDQAVLALSSDSEYHAFRTDFMNLYLKESLWDLKLSKIKEYYNDSEYAVFMNGTYTPAILIHDSSYDAGQKWRFLEKAYDDYSGNWNLADLLAGKHAYIQAQLEFDSDVDMAQIPYQNAGFSVMNFDASTVAAKVAKRNRILNIHKPACAKDAEFQMIAANMYNDITISGTDGTVSVEIGYETIMGYDYVWSNHYKDGNVAFTNTTTTYSTPLGFEVYAAQIEITNELSAFINVSGLPALFRLYNTGGESYELDAIQEKYDLYEITPSSVYQAQRAFQGALLSTKLKIADNIRASNFAELLDVITD